MKRLKYIGEWPEITIGSGPTLKRGEIGAFSDEIAAELMDREPKSWELQDAKKEKPKGGGD